MAQENGGESGGWGELKPSAHVKFFYSFGQMAQSGAFDTAIPFVFFYYTAVLGLSGGLVGAALAISLAFDAVVDPLIGSWSDNISSRLGRRLPLMIVATPLMCVALGLLFTPPTHLAQMALFGWLTVTSVAVRSLISVFNVPYIALGAELADGYLERSRVVAWRAVAGILGGVLVTVLAYAVFFSRPPGLLRAEGYPGFGWSSALALFVASAICCAGVMRYAASLPRAPTVATSIWRRLPAEMAEIFRNSSFRLLFFSAVLFYVAVGANSTLGNHTQIFVWKLQPWMMQAVGYLYLAGILVGIAMAPTLARRMEKKTMVIIGLTMVILVWTVLPVLRAAGLYVPTGVGAMWPLGFNSAASGLGVGFVAIAYPSMMADAADEHEHLFAARREGLYFAGLGFAGKAASGLGALVGGFALELLRFPQDAGKAGVVLPEGMLNGLILAWGPGAAVLGVLGLIVFSPYAISRQRHDAIAAELRASRGGALADPAS
jgi:glycoside/pentoside/hexuronide:cation symporter, GPH family